MRRILALLEHRSDLITIFERINEGAKVLDVGCGDGELLQVLKEKKSIKAYGIELAEEQITNCVNNGICVVQHDLDAGLRDYPDNFFDFVILSQTLQVLKRPDEVIKEVVRVGKKAIVSVPNFGYWKCRFDVLFKGKMPVTKALPYEWYDTPNLRVFTLKDFQNFCENNEVKIIEQIPLMISGKNRGKRVKIIPNLFAEYGVFILQKKM